MLIMSCIIFAVKWQSALCLNTNGDHYHISTVLYGPSDDWPDLFESLVHKKPKVLYDGVLYMRQRQTV